MPHAGLAHDPTRKKPAALLPHFGQLLQFLHRDHENRRFLSWQAPAQRPVLLETVDQLCI